CSATGLFVNKLFITVCFFITNRSSRDSFVLYAGRGLSSCRTGRYFCLAKSTQKRVAVPTRYIVSSFLLSATRYRRHFKYLYGFCFFNKSNKYLMSQI